MVCEDDMLGSFFGGFEDESSLVMQIENENGHDEGDFWWDGRSGGGGFKVKVCLGVSR